MSIDTTGWHPLQLALKATLNNEPGSTLLSRLRKARRELGAALQLIADQQTRIAEQETRIAVLERRVAKLEAQQGVGR